MSSEVEPEAVPIAYTSRGEAGLYAGPLTPADLFAPGGRWSVLRPPGEDHPQAAGAFHGLAFPTPEVGYVQARDGLLLKTRDGGRTWTFVRHDLPAPGAMLAFPTPSVGYLAVRRVRLLGATGRPVSYEANWELGTQHTLLRTGDGGQTWELLTPLVDAPLPGRNRAFLPHTTADAAAVATQLQLGQDTPEALRRLPGTLGYLRWMDFPSAEVGYALVLVDNLPPVEARVLLRSADAGHTWRVVLTREQLAEMRPYRAPVAFPLPDTGYVRLPGKLLWTIDGGITWEARPYPPGAIVSDVIFPTSAIGYALGTVSTGESRGRGPESRRVLLRTADGGYSWQQAERPGAKRPVPLACPSPGIIVAGGTPGIIWRTADGGRTWQEVESGMPHELLGLACPDEGTCYGVGSNATIVKSSDGGQSWQVLTTGIAALYRMLGAPHLARSDA